jgi:predicted transcriptional regulator
MDEILKAAIGATQAQARLRVMTAGEVARETAKLVLSFRKMQDAAEMGVTPSLTPEAVIPAGMTMALPAGGDAQVAAHGRFPGVSTPKRNPRTSIKKDRIYCVECGEALQILSKAHLAMHGLTPEQYREKWGIPAKKKLMSLDTLERQRASVVVMRGKAKDRREERAKQANKA